MSYKSLRTVLIGLVAFNLAVPAFAFHGGGGGGGHGGGGGGGFRGGGGGGGFRAAPAPAPAAGFRGAPGGYGASFNRTPAFRAPQAERAPIGNVGRGNEFNRVNSVKNINRVTNVNNVNVNRGGAGTGWRNPYMGYHQGWVHGNWSGHQYPGGWGNRGYGYGGYGYGGFGNGFGYGLGGGLGLGLGMGLGWGLSSWMFGPMLNNWGYSNYYNPYYGGGGYGGVGNTVVASQPVVYDYSQPIDPQSQQPTDEVASQANSTFDNARQAFQNGDYTTALNLTDQSIKSMPNDAALHEFRALCLFALKRYDEAAGVLYAVLEAGPGWDWTTLISLYGNPDAYTQQLRALESFCSQNPQSAAPRFVLGYHYLTQGHADAALRQFKLVQQLQPKDQLTAQLVRQLEQSPNPGSENPPAQGTTPVAQAATPARPAPGTEGKMEGTWTAEPAAGTTITMSFPDTGHFAWKVNRQGKDQQFVGNLSYENGLLTLVQDGNNNTMVGQVIWKDPTHFTFKVIGAGPDDPGLSFTKTA
jgi:Tetratricopeptide repeat